MRPASASSWSVPRSLAAHAARLVTWVVALAGPAVATTANDLCAPTADPCVVARTISVTPGSEIDVGDRELLIADRGALDLTSGTMTLRAAALTVLTGGSLLARGTTSAAGGRIIGIADTIDIAGTIDASGAPGGIVTLTSTDALLVAGTIDVRSRNSEAGGGAIQLQGEDVGTGAASLLRADGGNDDFAGDITIRASGVLSIAGQLSARGGDGGTIDLSADETLTVLAGVTLNADATITAGSGGSIDLSAIGAVVVRGQLTAVGRNGTEDTGGGDGGSITILGSSIDLADPAVRLAVSAGSPDGFGGDIDLTTNTGAMTLRGELLARGPGNDGNGGQISADAAGPLMLLGTIDASSSSTGGDVDLTSAATLTIAGSGVITTAGNATGGSIALAGGDLVSVAGDLTADGGRGSANSGGDIDATACTVRIELGSELTAFGSGGTNTLEGLDLTIVAGSLRAESDGRNVIRFAGAAYEPAILPGASFQPPVMLIVDASIMPCNPVETPTPTVTPQGGTPTVTPMPPTGCVGDCNGNGVVVVNELVVGVNIALGDQPLANCPAFDSNGDGQVTVNELIQGVNNALNGCPT